LIFLTLPYLPGVFIALEARYGRTILSTATNVFLAAIAALLVGYLARRKKERRKSAYLCLAGLLAAYGYCIYRLPIPSERIHLAEYGLLAYLIFRGLWKEGAGGLWLYASAATATYLIGMADETVQWLLPNRVGEFRDVLLNGLCGVLALGLTAVVQQPSLPPQTARSKSRGLLRAGFAIAIAASVLFRWLAGR